MASPSFLVDVKPFTYVVRDESRTFKNGRKLRFLVYGAYDAYGLIGTECNGVAVLDEDRRQVVADQLAKTPGCSRIYVSGEPTAAQTAMFERLLSAPWETVCAIVRGSGRARYDLAETPVKPKRVTYTSPAMLKRFVELLERPGSCSYHAENKAFFHAASKAILRKLARVGKLAGAKIHSNQGGIAVSGEVYLRTPTLRVCFEQSCLGDATFYFRAETENPTRMGHNRQLKYRELLKDFDGVARLFATEAKRPLVTPDFYAKASV